MGRAIRNYAMAKGLKIKNVTEDIVAADQLGIKGWADMAIAVGAGDSKPDLKATTKGKSKVKASATSEKDAKESMSSVSVLVMTCSRLRNECSEEAWAHEFLNQFKTKEELANSSTIRTTFIKEFQAASASGKQCAALKKRYGEVWGKSVEPSNNLRLRIRLSNTHVV